MTQLNITSRLLDVVLEHIDIPKSLYEKAAARHRSLGEWLKRDSSAVRELDPDIRPQGSFRFGTVTRPINADDEYDLDNVCVMKALSKSDVTQQEIKELYGKELKTYAKENGMIKPVEECNRCWRLHYSDEVSFHLDSLPCVPEDVAVIAKLKTLGVRDDWAVRAIAITDLRHPNYTEKCLLWPSSNPRGFAAFFEEQAALGRDMTARKGEARATVEDVPPYEWKTTLQRSIQILKRHRDVMFRRNPDLAPISMIITNLAANAYRGEADIATALVNIIDRMPSFIRSDRPRVPNPADPAEDYADKWSKDPRLEKSFWEWYYAVQSDIARLPELIAGMSLRSNVEQLFDVAMTQDELRAFQPMSRAPAIVKPAPAVVISSAAKPWGK